MSAQLVNLYLKAFRLKAPQSAANNANKSSSDTSTATIDVSPQYVRWSSWRRLLVRKASPWNHPLSIEEHSVSPIGDGKSAKTKKANHESYLTAG